MMRKITTILLALWLLMNSAFADVIKNYDVNITVLDDGRIDVVETIEIDTEFKQVKLGLIRDIPLSYALDHRIVKTPIHVISVTRNGENEPYDVRVGNNLLNIVIGQAEDKRSNYIKYGRNVYQIHWQSYRHIRQFKDYDELYFNAIGHNWDLLIEKANVTVHLPNQVGIAQATSYYGYLGAVDQAQSEMKNLQTIKFSSPEKLGKQKGMTVAVGFNKGLNIASTLPSFLLVNDGAWRIEVMDIVFLIPKWLQNLIGLTVILFVYLLLCKLCIRVIEQRKRKMFMVRYEPSENLIETMALSQYDLHTDKLITAMLVGLHAKGYIQLQKKGFTVLSYSMDDVLGNDSLSGIQKRFLSIHQSFDGKMIKFKNMPKEMLKDLFIVPYQASLSLYYQPLLENSWARWFGIGFYLLAIGVLIIYPPKADFVTYIMMILVLVITIKIFLPVVIILCYSIILRDIGAFLRCLIPAIFILFGGCLASLMTLGLIIPSNMPLYSDENAGLLVILVSSYLLMIYFHRSIMNIKVLDPIYEDKAQAINEFKHFLSYTKQSEYELITADLFDEYLPYAIVLGVDKKWVALYKKLYPEMSSQINMMNIASDLNSIRSSVSRYSTSIDSSSSLVNSSSYLGGLLSGGSSSSSAGGSSSGSGGGGSSGGGSGGGGGRGR